MTEAWIATAPKVTVITNPVSAAELAEHYAAEVANGQLTVLPHKLAFGFEKLPGRFPYGQQIHYLFWQLTARRLVNRLQEKSEFLAFHHLTYATDWMPTALPKEFSSFSVWGPVGGASRVPLAALSTLGPRGLWAFAMRSIICRVFRFFSGRANASKFSLMVLANDAVVPYFRKYSEKILVREGVFLEDLPGRAREPSRNQLIGVGRLTAWKGWAMAIKALTFLPEDFRLKIFGKGEDLGRLRRLAKRVGVESRVIFMGSHPREDVLEEVSQSLCLVHPSIHDTSPNAVGEALAMGVPVAGFDLAGVGYLLRRYGSGAVALDGEAARNLAEKILHLPSEVGPVTFSAHELVGDFFERAKRHPRAEALRDGSRARSERSPSAS